MRAKIILSGFAATAFGLLLSGGPAIAQRPAQRPAPQPDQRRGDRGFSDVHRAARAIEKNARDLHEEVDEHFRRSPAYRHLHQHTREIERLAKAIHDITDSGDGRRRLRAAVNRLDEEVHHFVEVVEDSKRFRDIPAKAYNHLRQEVGQLHRAVLVMKRQVG
jgi:hypothetical protein